jgi:PAS domain S-box-containing protein
LLLFSSLGTKIAGRIGQSNDPKLLIIALPDDFAIVRATRWIMKQRLRTNRVEALEKILDHVPAIVALYDIISGQYIYVSQGLTGILGYEPRQLIEGGLEFAISLVHPDDVEPMLARNQRIVNEANRSPLPAKEPVASFEYRMRHKSGGWRWVHTDGTVLERTGEGRVKLILDVSLDVTDRKQAQLEFSKSMKILEGVLNP